MKSKTMIPVVLLLPFVMLALVCQARSRDYVFSVTGIVIGEDGTRLQGADVILNISNDVYDAITPVKTAHRLSDDSGGFVFTYISHRRGVKYTLTACKNGFEPQTTSGNAPPAGKHTIRLKKSDRIGCDDGAKEKQ